MKQLFFALLFVAACFTFGQAKYLNGTNIIKAYHVKQAESGICSWYGAEGEIPPGWPTACGEGFDRMAKKAAHKTLPCGTRIRVRNTDNGRTVEVTINDRGPFTPGRIVDLTFGAFGDVENHDRGLFPCDYEIL